MLQARVGDQLVRPGRSIAHGEVVGVIVAVHGDDGGPPFTVRWYDDGSWSKITPNPERYWVRTRWDEREVGSEVRHSHGAA